MEIKFKNRKYYLKKLDYFLPGDTKITITPELKKTLRYQKIILIGEKTGEVGSVSLAGVRTVKVAPTYNEAWVIVKTKTKELEGTEKDEKVIKSFISVLSHNPIVCESLCQDLGNDYLSAYHSCYGKKALQDFKTGIFGMTDTGKAFYEKLIYDRPRYSIWSLVKDLKNSEKGVQIYTDPELIGKYKRISRKIKDGSETVLTKWAKLIGISGNRTRANLSLRVMSKVKVEVPENDHGVEAGIRELEAIRSFSLVADGKLNLHELGIKTEDTKLIGKLKRLGIAQPLLMTDEYLLNLEGLPVHTKKAPLSGYQLGKAEFMVRESEIVCTYLRRLEWMKKKGVTVLPRKLDEPEKSESELYLESLGIYGNYYYPDHTKTEELERTYMTTEVIGKINGIPNDLIPNIWRFVNNGSCKNKVIEKILTEHKEAKKLDLPELQKELGYQEFDLKVKKEYLRELKYRLIMGKTLILDSRKHLEDTKIDFPEYGVSVEWNVKESVIKV